MRSHAITFLLAFVATLFTISAHASTASSSSASAPFSSASIDQPLSDDDRVLIVTRARVEVGRVVRYSGEWIPVSGYPMGDIPHDRGACTDLVVRSLRVIGIDLQQLVHEDILRANRDAYPGVDRADAQVDHRRVAVLFMFFRRHLASSSLDPHRDRDTFLPGDIVFFGANNRARHVAIVSNRIGPRGLPLVLENGGPRPQESDALDSATRPLVGHFRIGDLAPRRNTSGAPIRILHK